MKVWSLNELFRLTRRELLELQRQMLELAPLPSGHGDRETVTINLRNIRIALVTRPPAPP